MRSIVSPDGYNSSTCGYCSPPGQRSSTFSSNKVGMSLMQLNCQDYQDMIDRGWRRSGTYGYKPDNRRSCCPQYTIRLDALAFEPSRKQRKVVHRWNRFVLEGMGEADSQERGKDADSPKEKGIGKRPKNPSPFSLVDSIHLPEAALMKDRMVPKHKFEVSMEPSSYTDEKFALFCHYQQTIHKEEKERDSHGFRHFLVDSPLKPELIPYEREPPPHLPRMYGSYHQMYHVDGMLIAVGVLDILPGCVSSVYFMYYNKWEKFSLGKLSAMREAALAREMYDFGCKDLKYSYMGYYIQSCQKMRYKGEYHPSYLLDPEENTWYLLKDCVPLLEQYRYACFTHPERSLKNSDDIPSKTTTLEDISREDAGKIVVISHKHNAQLDFPKLLEIGDLRGFFLSHIHALGIDLAKKFIFSV